MIEFEVSVDRYIKVRASRNPVGVWEAAKIVDNVGECLFVLRPHEAKMFVKALEGAIILCEHEELTNDL